MPNYGLLAQQGRREDNAAMGGQVAHISAVESELLRLLGGAGTTNPATGLPEYYTAASFGGTASFGGPGQSAAYGGYGPGGQAGGPGTSGYVGLTGASNVYGPPTTQQVAKLAQTKAIAKAKAKAKGKTNWGDAVLSADMATITQLGKDAYLKNAFDHAMDALALNYAKYAPLVNLGEAIFGPGPEGPITFLGEAIYGEGDGQTQTVTAAPPSISPTYAPTTGSIRLAQVVAEPTPPPRKKEVAEAELFDLGFPESPLLAGQRVFEEQLTNFEDPAFLAQFSPAIQDVLLDVVRAEKLKILQAEGLLA